MSAGDDALDLLGRVRQMVKHHRENTSGYLLDTEILLHALEAVVVAGDLANANPQARHGPGSSR